jgi:hypothetical protein
MGQVASGLIQTGASIGLQYYLNKQAGKNKTRTEGPRLADQTLSVSTYGADINQLYGQARVAGNMIWTSGIDEVVVETKQTTTGKGGGGGGQTVINTTYLYYTTFAMGVCEGPATALLKVFLDGKLVWDQTTTDGFSAKDVEILWYDGALDQDPAALITADKGPDTPGFRGLAYAIFNVLPLINYGNRIPNFTAIVSVTKDALSPEVIGAEIDGDADANSDCLLYDERSGYIYKFDHFVSGGSGTAISKIDITDGTVVYSKLIKDMTGANVTLHDGNGVTPPVLQSPIDGMIYASRGGSGGSSLVKINPDHGTVIDQLPGQGAASSVYTATALAIGQCPSTGAPIELFIARSSDVGGYVYLGMTGGVNQYPVAGGLFTMPGFRFQYFHPSDFVLPNMGASTFSWKAETLWGSIVPNIVWMLDGDTVTESRAWLTKYVMTLYFHPWVGIATPCQPKQQGASNLLRCAVGAGDYADRNGRTYEITNGVSGPWTGVPVNPQTGLTDVNLGASVKTGNTLVQLTGTATGGSNTTMIDTGTNFVDEGVHPGMTLQMGSADGIDWARVDTITTTTNPNDTITVEANSAFTTPWSTQNYVIRETFTLGNGGTMAYVSDDNTLIMVNNRPGVEAWGFAKFDVSAGQETMIEVRYKEDYEAGTSQDEFTVEAADDGSDIGGNVQHTWNSYGAYKLSGPLNFSYWAHYGGNLYRIDPVTMKITNAGVQDSSDYSGGPILASQDIVGIRNLEAAYADMGQGTGGAGSILYFRRHDGEGEDLADVVADLCQKAGLLSHEYDVSDLIGDDMLGIVIGSQSEIKESLVPLMLAYDFRYVESDWQIKFVKKGGASAFTLEEANLGVAGEDEVAATRRSSEPENVRKVSVRYPDIDRDHQENTQEAQRMLDPFPTSYAQTVDKIDIPIVFNASTAATIARRLLGRSWTERTELVTSVPPKYLGMDPLDVVTVNADGNVYTLQTESCDIGGGFQVKMTGVTDDAVLLTNAAAPGDTGTWTDQTNPLVFSSQLAILDVPLLRVIDDPGQTEFVLYSGFAYPRANFPGATAWWGPIKGAEEPWFSRSQGLEHGRAATALGDTGLGQDGNPGSTQSLDETNTVQVVMRAGITLSSATSDEGFLAGDPDTGGVKCLIGREIIQAKTVALNDGVYTLSDLHRGRRGTDWACFNHQIGETVTILNEGDQWNLTSLPSALLGTSYYTRAVTTGANQNQAVEGQFVFVGESLTPYSPVQVEGERDASNDLIVRWVRRTRMGNDDDYWQDAAEDHTELGELSEEYEVDLLVKDTFDPNDHTTATISLTRSVSIESPYDNSFDADFNDLGTEPQNTADIEVNSGDPVDMTGYQEGSWVRTTGFDQDDMDGFFVVDVATPPTATTLKIRIPHNVGDDTSNANARVRQLPTYAVFTAAEIAAAGYSTTDPVDVMVYQISGTKGRGHAGYDPLGVAR